MPIKQPTSWLDAFFILINHLKQQDSSQKKVVFFDEFPWMATQNSRLLQALDYYWNQYWSQDKRIKLIICGSSASWIIKNIINNRGGLHNRITQKIILEPFNLKQTDDFLKQQKNRNGVYDFHKNQGD